MPIRVLAVAVTLAASVLAPVRGQAPAATDVKGLLFEAANTLGMLRTAKQVDSITTQEYWAQGSMTTGGQSSKITDYRISLDYPAQGVRLDVTRTGADGKPQREIRVVAGKLAWNETMPGRGGTPAPPAAVRERLLELWSWPIGAVKAAVAAGSAVKVTSEGGLTVLTFPLPAPLADVTMRATLDRNNKHFVVWHDEPEAKARIAQRILPLYARKEDLVGLYIVRVETRVGDMVTDITYGEYGDWNPDDNKADVMVPRRVVKKEGNTTWDLRVTATNTYNPYVLMRPPDSMKAAQ